MCLRNVRLEYYAKMLRKKLLVIEVLYEKANKSQKTAGEAADK